MKNRPDTIRMTHPLRYKFTIRELLALTFIAAALFTMPRVFNSLGTRWEAYSQGRRQYARVARWEQVLLDGKTPPAEFHCAISQALTKGMPVERMEPHWHEIVKRGPDWAENYWPYSTPKWRHFKPTRYYANSIIND